MTEPQTEVTDRQTRIPSFQEWPTGPFGAWQLQRHCKRRAHVTSTGTSIFVKIAGKKMTLYRKQRDSQVRIVGIHGSKAVKRVLSDLGISIGDLVRIKRNAPFGGPVLIERNSVEVALGRDIAECILVEEAP